MNDEWWMMNDDDDDDDNDDDDDDDDDNDDDDDDNNNKTNIVNAHSNNIYIPLSSPIFQKKKTFWTIHQFFSASKIPHSSSRSSPRLR